MSWTTSAASSPDAALGPASATAMLNHPKAEERAMAKMQDVRKTIEGSLGNLTPTRAQEIAKGMLDRDAAKEQVTKTAADLMEWSQRNKNRLTMMIRNEVRSPMKQPGGATQDTRDAPRN